MRLWQRYEKVIDWISALLGRIGWILILYCTFAGVTDVSGKGVGAGMIASGVHAGVRLLADERQHLRRGPRG